MKVGIFGLAGSGKTTLFNLLTGLSAETGFGGGKKANIGVTRVPDKRIDSLAEVFEPKKTVFAELVFSDMPGQAPSKSSGGLDPQVIGELRTMDVLTLVVRNFLNPALNDSADAERDLAGMEAELILGDLAVIEKRVDRLHREKGSERELAALEECLAHLERELPLRLLDLAPERWELLRGYRFLSQKELLVVVNTPEDAPTEIPAGVAQRVETMGAHVMSLCADMEAEIAQLDPEEQELFLADLGVEESARDRFIQLAYSALDLISFLTSGPDECRAWTIARNTRAQDAAGKIHSDIARGFIRAETISYDDFEQYQDEQKAKAAGRYRLEGKDYIVQDGDIINFRFNV